MVIVFFIFLGGCYTLFFGGKVGGGQGKFVLMQSVVVVGRVSGFIA